MKYVLAIVFFFLLSDIAFAMIHPSYQQALTAQRVSGKPLVIIVGALWCPPCQKMKHELSAVQRLGVFSSVELCTVDYDQERALASALLGGDTSLPTTIIVWRHDGKVQSSRIVGYLNAEGYRELFSHASR